VLGAGPGGAGGAAGRVGAAAMTRFAAILTGCGCYDDGNQSRSSDLPPRIRTIRAAGCGRR